MLHIFVLTLRSINKAIGDDEMDVFSYLNLHCDVVTIYFLFEEVGKNIGVEVGKELVVEGVNLREGAEGFGNTYLIMFAILALSQDFLRKLEEDFVRAIVKALHEVG